METENPYQPSKRSGESVLIKVACIGALTLLLLIPSHWIQRLVMERQDREKEVKKEIADKWSGDQLISGPVMILPYRTLVKKVDSTGKAAFLTIEKNIYILPENLSMSGHAATDLLHRGIFDAVVYNTKVRVKGKFTPLELKKSGIDVANIIWEKAAVVIGISDARGLQNNPVIKLDGKSVPFEPDFRGLRLFRRNLIALPGFPASFDMGKDFSYDLDLRGSNELSFLHLGKSTRLEISGKWANPSFTGRFLPEKRAVSGAGFKASWKMANFSRPFPQQWVEENTNLLAGGDKPVFGIRFLLPVDQYQKTMRSAKYAILVILLTFIALLFTELLINTKIHVLQYVLIGAAMIIYYIMLLSFGEQMGFNLAYLLASLATIALIGIFIRSLLKHIKPALILTGLLTLFYGFIFVLIQLQDLALLFGSIGLFLIVAALMNISQRFNWEKSADEPFMHV